MRTLPSTLSFSTVGTLLAQSDALIAAGTLDLTTVARADSAGISFLLELTRRAQKRDIQLKITGANNQIRSLLKFFGLDAMLTLA
ncbi:MAG: STAS domain-containing protein [Cupriavidus sp.]|nr:MAG: STAS domain-containing protein [Cupriavidus sp.]